MLANVSVPRVVVRTLADEAVLYQLLKLQPLGMGCS